MSKSEDPFDKIIINGAIEEIKTLIKDIPNITRYRNDAGSSLLHIATIFRNLDAVKLLVENGADVNFKDDYGCSPLYYAVVFSKYTIIDYLIKAGADINARCNAGNTPMHQAVNDISLFKYLIQNGAKPIANNNGDTPLHFAAIYGDLDVGTVLLDMTMNVNVKNNDEDTPLHKAAYYGNLDVIKLLVERGANLDIQDKLEETALHKAAFCGKLSVVEFLLDMGVTIDIKNIVRDTPLHKAGYNGKTDVAEYLIQCDANLNDENKYGCKYSNIIKYYNDRIARKPDTTYMLWIGDDAEYCDDTVLSQLQELDVTDLIS